MEGERRVNGRTQQFQPVNLDLAAGNRVLERADRDTRWVGALEGRFSELTSLPRGWDGYLGCPVSDECVGIARNMLDRIRCDDLPPPDIVPGSDGTLQIEWHRNGFSVEIDILGPEEIHAWRYNRLTGEEEEMEVGHDLARIVEWVGDLVATEGRDTENDGKAF